MPRAGEKIKVIVLTTAYRLEGEVHVSEGASLMDELNKVRDFVPVYNTDLFEVMGGNPLDHLDFIAVNKSQILMITPAQS